MRYKPHVLPCISFDEARLFVAEWVKGFYPLSFVIFRAEESRLWVIEIPVVLGSFAESLIVGSMSQMLGYLCHAPVVEGLFQGDAHTGVLKVLGHIAILFPYLERTVQVWSGAALHHCSVSGFLVYAGQVGQDGIREHRYGVVAYHAIVVLSPQVPDGQIAVGLLMEYHVTHKLCSDVGAEQCVKRMCGPEGIP